MSCCGEAYFVRTRHARHFPPLHPSFCDGIGYRDGAIPFLHPSLMFLCSIVCDGVIVQPTDFVGSFDITHLELRYTKLYTPHTRPDPDAYIYAQYRAIRAITTTTLGHRRVHIRYSAHRSRRPWIVQLFETPRLASAPCRLHIDVWSVSDADTAPAPADSKSKSLHSIWRGWVEWGCHAAR